MTNVEKLNKINEDRILLLNSIKENIVSNNVIYNIDLIKLYMYDDINAREFKAIISFEELIQNLILEITNTTDIEEINKIRRKINYYISKIKNELHKRNIEDSEINDYLDNVSDIRKNISTYVRTLKRNNNLIEINNLINKENISEEENKKLKTLIKYEARYNKNHLKSNKNNDDEIDFDKAIDLNKLILDVVQSDNCIDTDNVIAEDNNNEKSNNDEFILENNNNYDKKTSLDEFVFNDIDDNDKKIDLDEFVFGDFKFDDEKKANSSSVNIIDDNFMITQEYVDKYFNDKKSEEEYMKSKMKSYSIGYHIKPLVKYNRNIISNVVSFTRNIPRYISNKKRIDEMNYDRNAYYSGDDFNAFIAYTKDENSIGNALKEIFKKSILFKRENECLKEHEKCMKYLSNYKNRESIRVA